jgi:hypothetical protein
MSRMMRGSELKGVVAGVGAVAVLEVPPDHAGHGRGRCAASNATAPPRILAAGHAFVQDLRRGHYDIATETACTHLLRTAFDVLAVTI